MIQNNIRVRFAPSPTGYLHLGSARTALFNWLYARHTGGVFVLRIEDTDKSRSKKEYLDEILEDIKWLGLDWDEGPIFQSERIKKYTEYATKLLDAKLAYREGEAIIFKVPPSRVVKINDMVHGEICFNTDQIKDQVLMKSDGLPAYNFACVIDDHETNITHIIRGDDHISNTPKQMLFYEALAIPAPCFAHMPLMMGKDGAKLSKRHGGVSVSEYKREGFLPDALANYLLLLGWSPGEEREIISLEEAAGLFDVKNLSNVQAKFDIDKLRWLNGEYMRNMDTKSLAKLLKSRSSSETDNTYFEKVVELYKTRLKTLSEFTDMTENFFKDDFKIEEDAKKKMDKFLKDENTKKAIMDFTKELEKSNTFTHGEIENICRKTAKKFNIKAASLIHPTRAAISGRSTGAGIFEMMEVLGKERVIERLKRIFSHPL
ncbi:MAG: glutamate--tRNA ligase [Candidatus Omnitrophica bacterium]|nr:glutamate--tRNA ligase [Candidatus Omnitrophota bacterium]